jgi:hypothetical protein
VCEMTLKLRLSLSPIWTHTSCFLLAQSKPTKIDNLLSKSFITNPQKWNFFMCYLLCKRNIDSVYWQAMSIRCE